MKNLLRLFLFIFARTGLFLAVVAWVGTQWWTIQVNAFFIFGGPASKAWVVSPSFERSVGLDLIVVRNDEIPSIGREFQQWPITYSWQRRWVSIQHWLVLTSFAVFNIILHFIYRKRPEAEPCEV